MFAAELGQPLRIGLSIFPADIDHWAVPSFPPFIIGFFAPGGGGYSGSKNVEVEGELRENGEVIGSFTIDRSALFGMTPGTCSMLKRVSKKIGEEVAEARKREQAGRERGLGHEFGHLLIPLGPCPAF